MILINSYRFSQPAGSSAPASVSYVGGKASSRVAAAHTLTGVPFGAAATRRFVVVAVHAFGTYGDSVSPVLDSATVGGVEATVFAQSRRNAAGYWQHCALIGAEVPAGTSGTVVLHYNASMTYPNLSVHRVIGLLSNAAVDLTGHTFAASQGSTSVDVQEDGVLIAAATCYTAFTASIDSGVTQRYRKAISVASGVALGGNLNVSATESNRTVAISNSSQALVCAMVLLSLR